MGIRASTAAKIVSLRRYIALLRFEENRLRKVLGTPGLSTAERVSAETNFKVIREKLTCAERELFKLKS